MNNMFKPIVTFPAHAQIAANTNVTEEALSNLVMSDLVKRGMVVCVVFLGDLRVYLPVVIDGVVVSLLLRVVGQCSRYATMDEVRKVLAESTELKKVREECHFKSFNCDTPVIRMLSE